MALSLSNSNLAPSKAVQRLHSNILRYLPVLLLFLLGFVYWAYFTPSLFAQDWWELVPLMQTGIFFPGPYGGRFFLIPFWWTLNIVFKLNITGMFVTHWIIFMIATIQFYYLVLHLTSDKIVAFGVAALYLVHPANYTHMWLSLITHWVAMIFTFAYAHLLVNHAETRSNKALIASLGALLLSLGFYEAQLGAVCAWSLFLAIRHWQCGWIRRLLLLTPLLIVIFFLFLRLYGYQQIWGNDPSYSILNTPNPISMLGHLWRGNIILLYAWTEPLLHALLLKSNMIAFAILLGVIAACLFVGTLISRTQNIVATTSTDSVFDRQFLRASWIMLIAGIALSLAGYVPIIVEHPPNLSVLGSRMNMISVIGASLVIVLLITVASRLLGKNSEQAKVIFIVGILPLLLYASLIQIEVRRAFKTAWDEQTIIWQTLIHDAPNFHDGTHIVIVDIGQSDVSRHSQRWDFEPLDVHTATALHSLYPDTQLTIDWVSTLDNLQFEPNQLVVHNSPIPYEQVIVLLYDRDTDRLSIIENLAGEGLSDFQPALYAPQERIVSKSIWIDNWRLVGLSP